MARYKCYTLKLMKVSESIHGVPLSSPKAVYDYMKAESMADREIFWILHLNNKNMITRKEIAAMGATDHCVIVPGIALRSAVANGTPGIISVHNHPSGEVSPSDEDRKLWKTLKEGCVLLGINVVDNIIIGNNSYYSEQQHK